MKITFEGISIYDVAEQMVGFLDGMETGKSPIAVAPAEPKPKPEPKAVAPKNKGGRPKLVKAAPVVEKPVEKPVQKPVEKPVQEPVESLDDLVLDGPGEEPVIDAAKLAAIRIKTTEDLQAAYSSGKHKQVLELLATYGNGAKSFRELTIKDFLPIRKAIDEGALA